MGWAPSEVVSGGGGVTSGTDIVWAVKFEMGLTTTGIAEKESDVRAMTGEASDWGWNRGGQQGISADGRSTLHKGSRDPGSKSRKATDGGVSDVKGRSAGVVT